jgi:hypothetical protein
MTLLLAVSNRGNDSVLLRLDQDSGFSPRCRCHKVNGAGHLIGLCRSMI